MSARKRLIISLLILLTVFWIGVIGYKLIDPSLALLDAIYMVIITISTVGYKEVMQRSPGTIIWTLIIILFGVSTAMVAVSALASMFIEGEIGRIFGSRKVETRIKQLEGHVIVCGFGRMGRLLVQRLKEEKIPLVVVEKDPEARGAIEKLEQLYIIGDATEEETLERAGLAQAQSLVAVLASDADNVFVTLTARQMHKNLNIVARAEQFSSIPKLRHAGANRVMSPQAIGAERIANIITRPHIVDFVDVAAKGVDLEMDEFTVSKGSPLAGKSLREANIRQMAEVMVVAIMRSDGTTTFNPAAEEVVRPQDTLITIGPAGATQRLAKMELIPNGKGE